MPNGSRKIAFALLLVILSSITARSQSSNLTAVVLVNSSNTAGFNTDPSHPGKFQRYTERYLEHFQIPYQLFDVTNATPPADLNQRQLIIAGHPGLSLTATWQSAISTAVNGGTGFVNLDSDPAVGTNTHIQAIFQATGSAVGTASSAITVPAAVLSGGSTPHFIAALQINILNPPSSPTDITHAFHPDDIGNTNTATATILQGAHGTVIAELGTDPLILATAFGKGRAVDFGTLDYLQADRFGFLMGIDDLFWRSLVWAARKPFVVRGYPRFWSLRMDNNLDSNWDTRIREMYNPALTGNVAADGTGGPWKVTGSVNLNFMPPGDAGRGNAIADINAGKLQISPHGFNSNSFGDLFWDSTATPSGPLTDSQWLANVTAIQQFQQGNGGSDSIPFFSKWWLGLFYNLSNNLGFDLKNTFGVRYIGTTIKPGFAYSTDPTQPAYQQERLQAHPYWIYQLPPKPSGPNVPFPSDESFSFFFADDLTIGSRADLAPQTFFLVGSRAIDLAVSDIPDLSWCNSQGDGAGFATARFEWYSWRLFTSMVPAEVYNQDDVFQPCTLAPPPAGTSFNNASEKIIHDVSTWLNGNGARHIFMQDMAQYIYARSKSKLTQASFDGLKISYTFTGSALDPDGNPVPTQALVFDNDSEGYWEAFPGFSNGLVTSAPDPPGAPTVVAVELVSVTNQPDVFLTVSGATQQLHFLATLSNGSTQDLSAVPGTTYNSNNTAVATVNNTGLVKAVSNGTAIITAANGGFSASATALIEIPPPDFSLPANLGSTSISAGQAATFNLSITPLGGFNQSISFTCTGVPAQATCAVSPNPVAPANTGTTVQVTISTTAPSSAQVIPDRMPGQPPALFAALACSLGLLLTLRRRPQPRLLVASYGFAAVLFCLGCGGGGGSSSPHGGGSPGTPSGTFTITVTGTSLAQSHTTTATLVVK